jgi:ABC-type multidrug transport system ATPase subunit
MGNPAKVAVRTLTMGVGHGECFGMLGPNGAGKTTTINMLGKRNNHRFSVPISNTNGTYHYSQLCAVGFTQPTSGTAQIEGFDIRQDMDRIYTLMGVCPQVSQLDLLATKHFFLETVHPNFHNYKQGFICGKVLRK